MKKLAILLLLSVPVFAQQINLGPNNPQVKGYLQPNNGGYSGGAWVNTTRYGPGAIVTFGGSTYIALTVNTGITPGTNPSFWILLPGLIYTIPSTTQAVLQPAGTTFTANSFNGELNSDLYTGANTAARILSAQTACTTNGCLIDIPLNSVAGALPTTSSMDGKSLIVDKRFLNSAGPDTNAFPGTHAFQEWTETVGALQPWETGSNVFTGPMMLALTANLKASAVGSFPTQGETIPLFIGMSKDAGSNRFAQGADINIGCNSLGGAGCSALELDINNGSGVDDTSLKSTGLSITTLGNAHSGIAIQIGVVGGAAGTAYNYEYGIVDNGYHQVGLNMGSFDPARVADILIRPPDDLSTSNSINLQNSAGNASTFLLADDGSVFSAPGYTSNHFKNSQGMQIATGTGCLSGTQAVGFACSVTMTLPVVESNTAYQITGCTISNLSGPQVTLGSAGSLTTGTFSISEIVATSVLVTAAGTVNCNVTHN